MPLACMWTGNMTIIADDGFESSWFWSSCAVDHVADVTTACAYCFVASRSNAASQTWGRTQLPYQNGRRFRVTGFSWRLTCVLVDFFHSLNKLITLIVYFN